MAKLLGGSQIYGNATVNSYLVVSGNADLSGGNVTIGSGNVTVTSILPSSFGTGYTSNPTVTITAPTTLYGGTATANANIGVVSVSTINNGGTGYAVNNVLTMVGTANAVSNATFTVTSVNSGVITGVSVVNPGVYFSSNTTSPVTVTGGTGSGATLTVAYGVNTPTVTYNGVGYVEQPIVTITGGGGTGATAYAVVGATQTRLQTLANSINFQLPSGGGLVLQDDTSGGSPQTYPTPGTLYVTGTKSTLGRMGLKSSGALFLSTASSNAMYFNTGGANAIGNDGRTQLQIVDTASSTNYVQVTGGATGAGGTVSVAGTDTNIDLNLGGKGTGNTKTSGNLVVGGNLYVLGNTTSVNYETVTYTETASVLTTTGNMNVGGALNVTGNVYGGGVRSTTSATPPANPVVGDIWYNSATDTIYRYTQDSTSSYWLNIFGPTVSSNSAAVATGTFANATVGNLLVTNSMAFANVLQKFTYTLGGGSQTNAVLILPTNDWGIYTSDNTYARNFLGKDASNNILIGQAGSGYIGNVVLSPGQSGGGYNFVVTNQNNNPLFTVNAVSNVTTIQGNVITNANITQAGYQVINSNINLSALQITGAAIKGGAGYHDFLSVTNLGSGVTNPNKYFRMNNTGNFEIINSAYTTNIFTLTDAGALTATPAAGGSGGSTTTLGYLGLPQNSQNTGYTLAISDQGKHVYVTATSTVTIPANGTVAFPIGTAITIISASGATTTVAITTDTLILAGSGATGSRTIAPYGMATIIKVTSTSWFISGLGVS